MPLNPLNQAKEQFTNWKKNEQTDKELDKKANEYFSKVSRTTSINIGKVEKDGKVENEGENITFDVPEADLQIH